MPIFNIVKENSNSISNWVSIAESIFTILAIIIGGIWTYIMFIKKRERYPRANISHKLYKCLLEDNLLIHLTVTIENISSVLMTIKSGEVRICQILPVPQSIKELIDETSDIVKKNANEAPWPEMSIREFLEDKKPIEIEPKEIDCLHFDFIIPKNVELIEVYSHLENIKKPKKEIGWNTTTLHKVEEITNE